MTKYAGKAHVGVNSVVTSHRQKWILIVAPIAITFAIVVLVAYFFIMNHALRTASGDTDVWAVRGQFGDSFGAVTCLFTGLTLFFVIYSIWQEARELGRQTDAQAWATNYQYLLEAKKLIESHPEVLELHGVPKDIVSSLGVTSAQVAYVVIDMKAADLYYRMNDDSKVHLSAYRIHLLNQELYCKILTHVVLPGQFLGNTAFIAEVSKHLEANQKP